MVAETKFPGAQAMSRRLFVLPFCLVLGGCYVLPLLYLLEHSFRERDPLGGFRAGYSTAAWQQLADPVSITVLGRSLALAAVVTILSLALATPTALWVRRLPTSRRRWVLLLFWLPLFVNSLLFAYGYILLLRLEGVVNRVLLGLGVVAEAVPFLFSTPAVTIGLVSVFFSFCFFPIYAGVSKIDEQYLHVSADLGASPGQTTRWVLVPLLRPSWLAGGTLVFVPMLGEFLIPDLLGGGKVITYATYIRLQFTSYADWPHGTALALLLVVAGIGLQALALKMARDVELF